jgi:hypothetical protein
MIEVFHFEFCVHFSYTIKFVQELSNQIGLVSRAEDSEHFAHLFVFGAKYFNRILFFVQAGHLCASLFLVKEDEVFSILSWLINTYLLS